MPKRTLTTLDNIRNTYHTRISGRNPGLPRNPLAAAPTVWYDYAESAASGSSGSPSWAGASPFLSPDEGASERRPRVTPTQLQDQPPAPAPEPASLGFPFELPVRVGFSFEVLRHLNCVRLGVIGVCPSGSECYGARDLETYEVCLERTAAETIRSYLLGADIDAPPVVACPSRSLG